MALCDSLQSPVLMRTFGQEMGGKRAEVSAGNVLFARLLT